MPLRTARMAVRGRTRSSQGVDSSAPAAAAVPSFLRQMCRRYIPCPSQQCQLEISRPNHTSNHRPCPGIWKLGAWTGDMERITRPMTHRTGPAELIWTILGAAGQMMRRAGQKHAGDAPGEVTVTKDLEAESGTDHWSEITSARGAVRMPWGTTMGSPHVSTTVAKIHPGDSTNTSRLDRGGSENHSLPSVPCTLVLSGTFSS